MRVEITVRGIKLVGSSGPRYSKEEFRQRADAIYAKIKDRVNPGNKGKILAIDIETGEYEVDDDKMKAVDRLFDRIDDPQIICYRIGYNAVTTLGGSLKEILVMIEGAVSYKLAPQIKLILVGGGAQEVEIEAEIDTNFNAGVSVPTDLIRSLGWIYDQRDFVTLGDGSEPLMDHYRGIVIWHGQIRLVNVLAAEATPLIGTELLEGNELTIQFKRGGSVTIAPLP